jgi:hypothetical protein
VELHAQPGWVAALIPLSVDGMIVAASTTLLADSRSGGRGGILPWALLAVGSVASLAANVAVAEPTETERVIAAWPSFALLGAYELLTRQVRRGAAESDGPRQRKSGSHPSRGEAATRTLSRPRHQRSGLSRSDEGRAEHDGVGRDLQRQAWQWVLANRRGDGLLPSGREIARAVCSTRAVGATASNDRAPQASSAPGSEPSEPGLRLVEQRLPSATGE